MQEISYGEAIETKFPEPVALAVSRDAERNRANVITLGWSMSTSHEPPMVAISVGHTRHSHKTIQESGEFVLVVPSEAQVEAVLFCGTHSGRDYDKFRETGLKPLAPSRLQTPLIDGACANFECKVVASCETGDHTIYVGEIVASHRDDAAGPRLYTMLDGSLKGLSGKTQSGPGA
jgi:flavin reductase (DIM6/NTAB) family NADH-FMN oxidoreductase RutF